MLLYNPKESTITIGKTVIRATYKNIKVRDELQSLKEPTILSARYASKIMYGLCSEMWIAKLSINKGYKKEPEK